MSSTSAKPMSTDLQPSASTGAPMHQPIKRIREVRTHTVTEMDDLADVLLAMQDVLYVLNRMMWDTGTVHGDVNTNTILLFDEPSMADKTGASSQDGIPTTGRGGLVYFDEPLFPQGRWRPQARR
ncbi:hypothetical protein BN946_scf184778.g4 [Trametes cinnabarina]|uniref:Fungal-type protein kinase domain-containing protein n=1 Tax=Pycnoporus cinnabarinus TaxID=5643 RepID=A0A060S5W9_PYCCI|nr:hypothetical protein BN946_scf184778.g4 [Trametes cinnabarina]